MACFGGLWEDGGGWVLDGQFGCACTRLHRIPRPVMILRTCMGRAEQDALQATDAVRVCKATNGLGADSLAMTWVDTTTQGALVMTTLISGSQISSCHVFAPKW